MSDLAERVLEVQKSVQAETKAGGTLTDWPCPFCGLPRSLRSDYVRCQPCGVNWWEGTDLMKNPHAKPAATANTILRVVNGTVVLSQPTDPK